MSAAAPSLPKPSLLGLRPSFGFGDRLGLATPGHLDAARKGPYLPIFAQQSVREMTRTKRTPAEVMLAAQTALAAEGYTAPWGADADHLKTEEDVHNLANAGFTFFTIDPSDHVDDRADALSGDDLTAAVEAAIPDCAFESVKHFESLYLGQAYEVSDDLTLRIDDREALYRALVKYGRAMAYVGKMWRWILGAAGTSEVEVSVDETATPTRPVEHLFIALELLRRSVKLVSLAPRFVGEFEKGIDYKGDLAAFEASLATHVAIARRFGPYKISVHSGSDKFSIYPILGRVCGDLLHVKTAGTSYLEALRVVAREAPSLLRQIAAFARSRFETDRATYHISARLDAVDDPHDLDGPELERQYLDTSDGRQILHVTFGSVLTKGQTFDGRPFNEALLEVLGERAELHRQLVAAHLGKHVELLQAG